MGGRDERARSCMRESQTKVADLWRSSPNLGHGDFRLSKRILDISPLLPISLLSLSPPSSYPQAGCFIRTSVILLCDHNFSRLWMGTWGEEGGETREEIYDVSGSGMGGCARAMLQPLWSRRVFLLRVGLCCR